MSGPVCVHMYICAFMRHSTRMHESVYVYALLCVSTNGHRHVCRCVHMCVLVCTCDSMPSGSCADVLWVYVSVCVYV